jgi:hypothetical protein
MDDADELIEAMLNVADDPAALDRLADLVDNEDSDADGTADAG